MSILSAIYLAVDGTKTEILLSDITATMYENKLKRNLYCPTENCPARIIFSGGKKAHFRTWRLDKHSSDCEFQFDRIPENIGVNTTGTINVEIPHSRRQKALQEAFRIMNLSEEDLKPHLGNSPIKPRNKKRTITIAKKNVTGAQLVLFEGEEYDHQLVKPRTYICKRFVDEIKEMDIGKIRLVMGYVVGIRSVGVVSEIQVGHNNQLITAVFEEAFISDRFNSSYVNKFWSIERLRKETGSIRFTGIGEIRKNAATKRMELAIYRGSDFKVDNIDMSNLASQFTIRDLKTK
ncbi:hypothetical protein ORD22_12330 [Sporosarcina sp. GW1-11]|uniref:hypothetical protein n=1 Tax=Sporosarcina sp. GW1-11 TaxID=2899126 RepID=UPI00294BDA2C|nr:hypothetical protein [Sporosarcina sp. GW1-11]MDV6379000.1 hypothetical protein [Sporosarcina sp. GW1-11]